MFFIGFVSYIYLEFNFIMYRYNRIIGMNEKYQSFELFKRWSVSWGRSIGFRFGFWGSGKFSVLLFYFFILIYGYRYVVLF